LGAAVAMPQASTTGAAVNSSRASPDRIVRNMKDALEFASVEIAAPWRRAIALPPYLTRAPRGLFPAESKKFCPACQGGRRTLRIETTDRPNVEQVHLCKGFGFSSHEQSAV
jgi:hypothetical protein